MSKSILIVEDDLTFALMLKTWLGKKGFNAYTASSYKKACNLLSSEKIDVVLSDLRLPDHDGIELLSTIKQRGYNIPLIIMTGYADIQSAVHAIKMGASDYIGKPIQPDELLKKIEEALDSDYSEGSKINMEPDNQLSEYLEGKSAAAIQLYNYVNLVGPTNMSVLINGASGTGKENIAHKIHICSKRAEKPFVAIDCGSIPKELAASEFFGHVKGAFTGAVTDKVGAFAEADGGTLFLDEIGNLSYEVQVQLLRALQERRIRPVGSGKEIDIDVRLVSATNENLQEAIEKGTFREDLYHRINEFIIRMPSLSEREEDIILFADFFLKQANKELGRNILGFDDTANQAMLNYSWPGNLRQMKNIIRRATLLATGNLITSSELQVDLSETARNISPFVLKDEENEKRRIIEALQQTGNNKTKAAILLGIDRKTLYNKIKQYQI